MTTASTVLGLSPLAFAMAVGLERMSPLAIIAGSGLIVGTVFTLVVTPVAYSALESLREKAGQVLKPAGSPARDRG